MLDHLRELVHYQEWADSLFFKRWKDLRDAHENEEIRKLTDHFTLVQKIFLQALHKETAQFPDPNASPASFSELRERSRENHMRLTNFVATLQDETLSENVPVVWFPGDFKPTIYEAVIQMIMHTQHHRAQVLQKLARSGEKSVIVDWILWVYKGKPAATWE